MTNDAWKAHNDREKKIMEEQERLNRGKTYPPVKIGTRAPGTPVKKTATKKKTPAKKK